MKTIFRVLMRKNKNILSLKTLHVLKSIVWRWDYSPGICCCASWTYSHHLNCNSSQLIWIVLSAIDTLDPCDYLIWTMSSGFALGLFKSNNHRILGVYLTLTWIKPICPVPMSIVNFLFNIFSTSGPFQKFLPVFPALHDSFKFMSQWVCFRSWCFWPECSHWWWFFCLVLV